MTSKKDKYLKKYRAILNSDSEDILKKFKSSFGYLNKKGLKIGGIVNEIENINVIDISHPLIFDCRKLPKEFMGIQIKGHIDSDTITKHFKKNNDTFDWQPDNFEAFVNDNEDVIRKKLGLSDASKEELLDAICFGDFKMYKRKFE